MKILLFGEYSNVHNGLADGLRQLGNEVYVVSDGDGWKNYNRDIDLSRKSTKLLDTIFYLFKLKKIFHKLKGFDVVQIINPIFLELSANKIKPYYDFLKENNKSIFMGAFGMDYYWVKTCLDCKTFRYSDFNIGPNQRLNESYNEAFINDWLYGEKGKLNQYIANDCDGIISGLYEYFQCYNPYYPQKTTYIPLPITDNPKPKHKIRKTTEPINFFIGIQKDRHEYKGTDIMLRALERIKSKYPEKCNIIKAESVPFDAYSKMMNSSDVLLDQLYSYTPGMNGLLAMSKGIILVGGGEEEHYELLNENELRPIINVIPDEQDVYEKLEWLINNKNEFKRLSEESVEYIKRHHNNLKVAKQYMDFWSKTNKKK